MKTKEPLSEQLFFLIVGLLFVIPSVLWHAYVVTVIYTWYAPTAWPELAMSTATGMCLIVGLLRTGRERKDSESLTELLGSGVYRAILGPLFTLGFARLLLVFVG